MSSLDWTQLHDRAEIKSHLATLEQTDQIGEDDVAFLMYCFRASDPELYQRAAITIGRKVRRDPAIFHELMRYAAHRKLALDRPVAFNGHRSVRRVLIVLAAVLGDGGDPHHDLGGVSWPNPPFPTDSGPSGVCAALPSVPADLSSLLLAMRLLVESPVSRDRFAPLADDLLLRIAGDTTTLGERFIARRWSELLARRLAGTDARSPLEQALVQVIVGQTAVLRALPDEAMGERLRGLAVLDELVRGSALIPDQARHAVNEGLNAGMSTDEAAFVALRQRTWRRREACAGGEAAPVTVAATSLSETSFAPLRAAAAREAVEARYSAIAGASEADLAAQALEAYITPFGRRADWNALSGSERGLTAFLLIDALRHESVPPRRAEALAERQGLQKPGTTLSDSKSGSTHSLLAAVMLRLLAWEGAAAEHLLDHALVHSIEDPVVVAGLIPTARGTPQMALIADAVENLLRSRLRGEPGFDPEAFLAMLLVRRPAPGFLASLKAVCADRPYSDHEGASYPLVETLNRLATLAASSAATTTASACQAEAGDGVIARLEALGLRLDVDEPGSTDPRGRLADLLALIGHPEDATRSPASRTAIGLLRDVQPPSGPLIAAGARPWSDEELQALEAALTRDIDRIAALSAHLGAQSWRDPEALHPLVGELRERLAGLEARIAPHLPARAGIAFERALRRADAALADWMTVMTALAEAWQDGASERERGAPEAWTATMTRIPTHWDPRLRDAVGADVLAAIAADAGVDGDPGDITTDRIGRIESTAPTDDPGSRGIGVLDWALARDASGPEWERTVRRLWQSLLLAAMAHRQETRVLHLLQSPKYAPARRSPDNGRTLEAARAWCMDRYRPLAAHAARRELAAARKDHRPGLASAFSGFGAHFAAVWIGLLVGAILMLDFGDAWTSMAEQGDVPGIAVTFTLGLAGTYAYLFHSLRTRVRPLPGESAVTFWASGAGRAAGMLGACLLYTLGVTALLWFLLSGTDEVVHGPMALGHIVVWAGFALFIGIFFGLIAKQE